MPKSDSAKSITAGSVVKNETTVCLKRKRHEQVTAAIPRAKRMTRIIIPIHKSSIISGFLLPFMTCLRELSLFMLLCVQGFILSTTLDYFDEMGLYAFSSGINLILIITILICNTLVNKITGASLDKGIGG